jgi:hypothetical protein
MVSRQWSGGVDYLRKSFVEYNASFNASFHSVLASWKTADNTSSDTDVAAFEQKRKKEAGDGNRSSSFKQQEGISRAVFSSEEFDTLYTIGEEVRYIAFRCIRLEINESGSTFEQMAVLLLLTHA